MPQRSTPFQAIVYMVRQHYAGPEVTVTESKMLWDPVLLAEREVDIVVEGEMDGEPFTISIEVIEHKRKGSVTWAEQLIAKHRTLPTDKLILVSAAGFSATAKRRIAMEAGKVEAMEPKLVYRNGQAVVEQMVINQLEFEPLDYHFIFDKTTSVAASTEMMAMDDRTVFDAKGKPIGDADNLVKEMLRVSSLINEYVRQVEGDPRPEEARTFTFSVPVEPLGYYRRDGSRSYHIVSVGVEGKLAFRKTTLDFTIAELGKRRYASGQGNILGQPNAAWVKTKNESTGATAVSLRLPSFGLQSVPDPAASPFSAIHSHIDALKKTTSQLPRT